MTDEYQIDNETIAEKNQTDRDADFESLVIGETLFEEDSASPIDVSGTSSTTVTLGTSYPEVVLLTRPSEAGFDQLQINGDTSSNYRYIDSSDTLTTGETEFDIPFGNARTRLQIRDVGTNIRINVSPASGSTGETVWGLNNNLGGNGISELTLSDSGGTERSAYVLILGRDI